MINIITKGISELKYNESTESENENGNTISHLICAFSKDLNIRTNEDFEYFNNSKNMNGWAPIFYSNFKGTKKTKDIVSLYSITSIKDYFGNDESFYLKTE